MPIMNMNSNNNINNNSISINSSNNFIDYEAYSPAHFNQINKSKISELIHIVNKKNLNLSKKGRELVPEGGTSNTKIDKNEKNISNYDMNFISLNRSNFSNRLHFSFENNSYIDEIIVSNKVNYKINNNINNNKNNMNANNNVKKNVKNSNKKSKRSIYQKIKERYSSKYSAYNSKNQSSVNKRNSIKKNTLFPSTKLKSNKAVKHK